MRSWWRMASSSGSGDWYTWACSRDEQIVGFAFVALSHRGFHTTQV